MQSLLIGNNTDTPIENRPRPDNTTEKRNFTKQHTLEFVWDVGRIIIS